MDTAITPYTHQQRVGRASPMALVGRADSW
jgi:hypothetical protein